MQIICIYRYTYSTLYMRILAYRKIFSGEGISVILVQVRHSVDDTDPVPKGLSSTHWEERRGAAVTTGLPPSSWCKHIITFKSNTAICWTWSKATFNLGDYSKESSLSGTGMLCRKPRLSFKQQFLVLNKNPIFLLTMMSVRVTTMGIWVQRTKLAWTREAVQIQNSFRIAESK